MGSNLAGGSARAAHGPHARRRWAPAGIQGGGGAAKGRWRKAIATLQRRTFGCHLLIGARRLTIGISSARLVVGRAPEVGAQINLRHDALRDQEFVAGFVDLDNFVAEGLLDDVLHSQPRLLGQPSGQPLLQQGLRTGFWAQDIRLIELFLVIQHANAHLKITEFKT